MAITCTVLLEIIALTLLLAVQGLGVTEELLRALPETQDRYIRGAELAAAIVGAFCFLLAGVFVALRWRWALFAAAAMCGVGAIATSFYAISRSPGMWALLPVLAATCVLLLVCAWDRSGIAPPTARFFRHPGYWVRRLPTVV